MAEFFLAMLGLGLGIWPKPNDVAGTGGGGASFPDNATGASEFLIIF